MTILKTLVHHIPLWMFIYAMHISYTYGMLRSLYKTTSLPTFCANSIAEINYCNAVITSSACVKV